MNIHTIYTCETGSSSGRQIFEANLGLNECYDAILMKGIEIEFFDLFTSPICFTEKFEAGFHGWVISKASDFNKITQFFPTIMEKQLLHDKF